MTKFRTSLIVIGTVLLCAAVALVTFLSLSATGFIATDPKELVIAVENVTETYDARPHTAYDYSIKGGELLEGHSVQVLSYIGSQTEVGESESDIGVRIVDENDLDVTASYAIRTVPGRITVIPRSITVDQGDVTETYTGKPVYNSNFSVREVNGLCLGHRLVPSELDEGVVDPEEKAEGKYAPEVYDAAGNNVTANYIIVYNGGYTTVEKRTIKIQPVNTEKTYDGKALLTADNWTITAGTLADGHEILDVMWEYRNTDRRDAMVNAGTVEAHAVAVNLRGVDDAEKYYVVKSDWVRLTVNPRAITVTGGSTDVLYDGKTHASVGGKYDPANPSSEENTADVKVTGGLAEGDYLDIEYTESIVNAGTIANNFEVKVIKGGDGAELNTANYTVHTVAGTLTVRPISITLTGRSETYRYDGTARQTADCEYRNAAWNFTDGKPADDYMGITGLLAGSEYLYVEYTTEKTNVGIYENKFTATVIRTTDDGNFPVDGENYNIKIEYGTLTVKPREITVIGKSDSREYNGSEITSGADWANADKDNNCRDVIGDTADGETLQIKYTGSITRVGNIVNYFEWKVVGDGGNEIDRSNYTVTAVPGMLEVTRYVLKIVSESKTETYGEGRLCSENNSGYECFRPGGAKVNGNELPDRLEVNYTAGISNAGTVDNTFDVSLVSGERSMLDCYDIEKVYGTLTIDPRPVTLEPGDLTYTYSGKRIAVNYGDFNATGKYEISLGKDENAVIVAGFDGLNADEVHIALSGTPENADSYEITVTLNNPNYTLTNNTGTLKINKANVKADAETTKLTMAKTYDGERAEVTSRELNQLAIEGFADLYVASAYLGKDIVTPSEDGSPYQNVPLVNPVIMNRVTGENVTANFNLNTADGNSVFVAEVTINRRRISVAAIPITVDIYSMTFDEWEDDQVIALLVIGSGSLVYGDHFGGSPTADGDEEGYTVEGLKILDAENNDVSRYYNVNGEDDESKWTIAGAVSVVNVPVS